MLFVSIDTSTRRTTFEPSLAKVCQSAQDFCGCSFEGEGGGGGGQTDIHDYLLERAPDFKASLE